MYKISHDKVYELYRENHEKLRVELTTGGRRLAEARSKEVYFGRCTLTVNIHELL